MRKTRPLAARFWEKVDRSGGPNACWPWLAARWRGYGIIGVGHRRTARATHVAWELTRGPIPDGLIVCHHCDNPPCVNPAHLFIGTHADNIHDCARKGRAIKYQSRQTHCKRGHEFTPANTRRTPTGHRICIACNREWQRRRYAKNREAMLAYQRAYRAAHPWIANGPRDHRRHEAV